LDEALGDKDFAGIVKPANDDGYYAVNYSQLIAPMIKAIQEQQKEIDNLKEKISQLEKMKME